ncbi:hypothetical protein [Flagellimonas allohymeniacidonis]|uniref:Uncharacterized protein n=1 Tax=Flagellimonas allohymeniacidonis TaxID=2517819 RepID=A0A4Q8Q8R4_9FLAO|nr:hypothetical protein [Allomuricauda hymeniacidonis]TAI46615.1 hypothetical protein EW142_16180 [Allomuricauda hymeniacidonis]
MSNDYKSPQFKKLLDSLQQQSWELELIISGFAIFGLFTAYDPLKTAMMNAQNEQQIYSFIVHFIAYIACSILLFNLLLHVILRGLWIGALGLRYVSGDIEFENLKYSEKFKSYLKKRIVSFDRYIANLENYCSVLFAISFLLIFYVLALTCVILTLTLVANFIIGNDALPGWISKGVGIPLMIFLCLGMLITLVDFLTQGLLKRNKWVAKVYFPIYWVFSFLTLSFLYRPLIYNFLDNRFGKRLILLLTPIYFIILLVTSIEYRNSNFLDKERNSSEQFANKENYFDLLINDEDYPGELVIPSKVITTSYLQVFMPFSEGLENRVFAFDSTLVPEKDRRGLTSTIEFNSDWSDKIKTQRQKDSIRKHFLKVVNAIYSFQIDTLELDGEFLVTTNIKDQLGFETVLNLNGVDEGKHLLQLKRKKKEEEKDTVSLITESIPFWLFREK